MKRPRAPRRNDDAVQARNLLRAIAAGVAAVTAAAYVPALRLGFVNWDDPAYVYQRPEIHAFNPQLFVWAFQSFAHGTWHPLTWVSLALDHAIWELRPHGYHLTNVGFHAINAGLTVCVAAALFRSENRHFDGARLFACAVIGLFFGVHPLHVESVAWVSSRKDVLYGLFWLLGTLAYLRYATADHAARRRGPYAACLLLFACALMSKPMAITFPVMLLLLDWYPLRRIPDAPHAFGNILGEKAPFLLLSLAVAWLTYQAASGAAALGAMTESTFAERGLSTVRTIGAYLVRTVYPVQLVPYYPFDPEAAWSDWLSLASLGLIIGVTAAAWLLRRRMPGVATAWLYFLVTLAPVLGFVRFGSHAAADRYMYLPLLGPLMLCGAAAANAWTRWPGARHTLSIGVALLLLFLVFRTREQIQVWRDSITLWESVVARTSPDAKPLYNLGNAYKDGGYLAAARNAWARVLEIQPNHSLALNQLGNLALLSNQLAEARDYYARAVAADPGNVEAHYNFAVTLERSGEREAARREYERFLELAPREYADVAARVRRKLSQ